MLRPRMQPMAHFVDDLITVAHTLGEDEAIAAAAPIEWAAGLALVAKADAERRMVGYVLVLAALNRRPEILRRLAHQLCSQMAGMPTLTRPERTLSRRRCRGRSIRRYPAKPLRFR